MIIDTHAHLYVEEFKEDYSQVIKEALAYGVEEFHLPAIDQSYHKNMMQLETEFPSNIKLMMGLHPCYVKPETVESELEKVYKFLQQRPFSAVGEIGIDLYWETENLELQKQAFRQQIQWAKECNLPIVIHSRNSFDEVFETLEAENDEKLKGIFHCFTGNLAQAQQAIRLGFKLGIGGVVTFKNGKIDQFLSEIGLENIVLETDSPYLAPVPYRGKRNQPKYLEQISEKLATIYQKPLSEIHKKTTQNALGILNQY